MNPSQSQQQKELQQEQRNLLAQQSELESLQFIFDRQLEILVDNCQALLSSSSMTSDEEKKNDENDENGENDEKSYEFQIWIPPTNDEDSKVFDMIVNRFENDDQVEDQHDKVDDFDADAIQNFDILQLRYHVRDLGYRIVFALNAQYPSSAIPHSIRVQNLNLRGGEWNESLIQRILSLDEQNSGNHDAENELVHRDLRQLLRFKVMINEQERQSMQAFLEEHAREWLENVTAARNSGSSSGGSDAVLVDNEEPMIYYLINLLRDFVDSGGGGGDSELDRLMSEYKSSGTSPSSSSPISIGYEGPLPLKRNDYSKKKQFNGGRNSGGDENFSHIYKYAFRDVSKKGAPASNQYLSLTPYLILNKFSQSKVATSSRFRRSLQMTCQSKYNFVIAYGGIDVRNQVLTSQVRYLSKDCLTATSIRTFGDTPTNRVLATLTALEDHPTDKFLLIGGMSSMQSMLNDIFLLEILDPITNKGLNLNDMTLDTVGVKWRCIAMTSTGLCGHSACYYRKKRGVWVFGGLTPRGYSNKLMYVTDNGKVKELETRGAPRPRSGHAMSKEIEESIFVFGGHDDQGVFNDLHMLNTDTLMWTSIVVLGPSPNLTHCSGRALIPHLDNTFIIHGGFNGKKWTNDTYIFDTHEKRWRICFVPKEQAVLISHSQPVFNALEATQDNILVMGGESEDMYRSNLNYLNYGSFVEHTLKSIIPKSVESPPTINYKHNSHMNIQYRDSTLGKLSKVRFNWFEEQDEENCDVVLIFEDDQTDQYVNLCCHKLILQQCPKLVQLILKAERNEGTNLQHGVRTNIRMSAQQGLGTYTAHEWKTVCQYLYSGMIALNDSVRQDKHLSKVKSLAKTLQIQALCDLLSGTVSFSTILNENMPLISEQLSRSFLTPKLLSPEEHARILHEVEMEQMLTMESVDFSSIAADEHGTNGQTVIDDSNYMKNGLVKLIARNNGSQSELDQYMCIVCHKGILLHHSLYFKTVFNSQFSESVSGIARIDQLSIQALEALCNYMYTGFLPEIETSQILELYIVSHQFIMEELGPWLRYLIRQHIDVNIACAICDISEKLSDEIMRKFCISYIAKHLDTIMDPNMKEDESDQYMFDTFRDLSSRTRIDIRTAYFNNLKAKQKIEKRASNKLNK